MFHKFPTSSGDSTAAAIRKQVRTRPELRLLIVPGISLSTVQAKVTASQHHNRWQTQSIWVMCEALLPIADHKKKPLPGPPSTDSAVGPKGMSLTMRVVKETWAVEGFHRWDLPAKQICLAIHQNLWKDLEGLCSSLLHLVVVIFLHGEQGKHRCTARVTDFSWTDFSRGAGPCSKRSQCPTTMTWASSSWAHVAEVYYCKSHKYPNGFGSSMELPFDRVSWFTSIQIMLIDAHRHPCHSADNHHAS